MTLAHILDKESSDSYGNAYSAGGTAGILFVGSGALAALDRVTFANDKAIGGNAKPSAGTLFLSGHGGGALGQNGLTRPPTAVAPDGALLFAWNHADDIMAKEGSFVAFGRRWLVYVPDAAII